MSGHGHGGPPPPLLKGHRVSGWVCSECGVLAPSGTVVPEIRVERNDGELTPVLLVWADDGGHAQRIVLGWDNLDTLVHQAMVAHAEDPDDDLIGAMPPDVAADLLEGVRRSRRRRGEL